MEPIVVPLQVHFSRDSAAPVTYPTGTLVGISMERRIPSNLDNTIPICRAIEQMKLTTDPTDANHIGKFVQPPNCVDAYRGVKDVIHFTPEYTVAKLAILADPLTLPGSFDYEKNGEVMNTVFISAAVGGVVELDWGPQTGRNLTRDTASLTARSPTAVAGADVYIVDVDTSY